MDSVIFLLFLCVGIHCRSYHVDFGNSSHSVPNCPLQLIVFVFHTDSPIIHHLYFSIQIRPAVKLTPKQPYVNLGQQAISKRPKKINFKAIRVAKTYGPTPLSQTTSPHHQTSLKSADWTLESEIQWTLWCEKSGHFEKKRVATFRISSKHNP